MAKSAQGCLAEGACPLLFSLYKQEPERGTLYVPPNDLQSV